MISVLQRVSQAQVRVGGEVIGGARGRIEMKHTVVECGPFECGEVGCVS